MTGLLTVDQLRERIGGAIDLTSDVGRVFDADLQNLIDEEARALREKALAVAREKGLQDLVVEIGEQVVVTPGEQRAGDGVGYATLPSGYFPFVFHARTFDNKALTYDAQIETTAATEIIPGMHHRFALRGAQIAFLPRTAERLFLVMAPEDAVITHVVGHEIPAANDRIVARAQKMLQATIAEQTRQMHGPIPEED